MAPRTLNLEKSISQLPLRLRAVARAAAAGSRTDIQCLINLTRTGPASQSQLFLPVFYAHLDPRKIPTAGQLDAILASAEPFNPPIDNAVWSLLFLTLQVFPNRLEPAATLWHRIWPWLHFLDCHWTLIPQLAQHQEANMYGMFVVVLGALLRDEEVGKYLAQTPGVHVFIGRAWKLLVLGPEPAFPAALTAVSEFLSSINIQTGVHTAAQRQRYVEELCEGAGGSLSDLAFLVVQHLDRHMVELVSEESAVYLVRVVAFATSSKNSVPFQEALLYHGIVGTVTRASRGWAKIQDKLVAECIFPLVLEYLGWQFHGLWAYRYLREAIRGGLLHVIIACIPISVCEEFLAEILDMLTPHTVYYSVLSCLESMVDEITELQVSPAFEQSPMFPKWCAFWNLTQERMKVKKCYDSQSYVSSKACDNVSCGRMHRRRDLLRCAGCRGPYYCSKDCQKADWKAGHQNLCRRLRCESQECPEQISTRDCSFLRTLANHDYRRLQGHAIRRELDFLREFPGDTFCLNLDYKMAHARIGYFRQSQLDICCQDEARRQTQSGGRVQLRFVSLPNGAGTSTRLLPMHFSSAVLSDGVKRLRAELDVEIARESAPTETEIRGRIRALMDEAETDAVQGH